MERLEQALKQYFGYDAFFAGQREIIALTLAGHDALVLMPTGGGKSLLYQLPALLLPGVALVISPLIALMQDQVERLAVNGIAATFINSSLSSMERAQRERDMVNGHYKLVYVAPERVLNESFLALLEQVQQHVGLSLLAIDEAHCVSEWGHDFRPEYRLLWRIREHFPHLPLLALTATATERVREDILAQLRLRDPYIHIASFNRPNLSYEVRQKHQYSYKELVQLLRESPDASSIIYCQSRKGVVGLCENLVHSGINALPYHAGMEKEERTENQARFIRDDVPVLVATIAFGMGIAKPDVRTVIHYDLPRSLEGYYQESGRAGRDGLPALCILFFSHSDRVKQEYLLAMRYEEQEQLIARQQLRQVTDYCESLVCRRKALLAYFGETLVEPCNNCDVCAREITIEDRTIDAQKFLSCVARTRERFGMRHVIDILRGANTQKIRSFGHDQLSTYGIGRDYSLDEWLYLGRALLQQGLLSETQDGFPVLRLNALSKEVLRGQRIVEVAIPEFRKRQVQERVESVQQSPTLPVLDADSSGLFHHLRAVRKQLADEQGVPPYFIFHDTSLHAMAVRRPQTREQFSRIPGVGDRKLEGYYTPFTSAIADYCVQHHLPLEQTVMEQKPQPVSVQEPSASPGSPTRIVTLDLYNEGLGIEEIAAKRNLKASTIASHLAELIEAGMDVDTSRLISPERYQVVATVIEQTEGNALKPVKDALGDDYTYEDIRIVRAMMRRIDFIGSRAQAQA